MHSFNANVHTRQLFFFPLRKNEEAEKTKNVVPLHPQGEPDSQQKVNCKSVISRGQAPGLLPGVLCQGTHSPGMVACTHTEVSCSLYAQPLLRQALLSITLPQQTGEVLWTFLFSLVLPATPQATAVNAALDQMPPGMGTLLPHHFLSLVLLL